MVFRLVTITIMYFTFDFTETFVIAIYSNITINSFAVYYKK